MSAVALPWPEGEGRDGRAHPCSLSSGLSSWHWTNLLSSVSEAAVEAAAGETRQPHQPARAPGERPPSGRTTESLSSAAQGRLCPSGLPCVPRGRQTKPRRRGFQTDRKSREPVKTTRLPGGGGRKSSVHLTTENHTAKVRGCFYLFIFYFKIQGDLRSGA